MHVVVHRRQRVVQRHVVLVLDAQQQRAVRGERVQEGVKHLQGGGGTQAGDSGRLKLTALAGFMNYGRTYGRTYG